jgi:hypothetical protein
VALGPNYIKLLKTRLRYIETRLESNDISDQEKIELEKHKQDFESEIFLLCSKQPQEKTGKVK